MFWFKRKTIIVDCFTIHRSVYELYKIRPAIKYFPDETKTMPNFYDQIDDSTKIKYQSGTIIKCIGLINLYKHGFIMPMWTDFLSEPKTAAEHKNAVAMVGLPFQYQIHSRDQFGNIFEKYIHVKLEGPWRLREKTGVQFLWNAPVWNLHKHTNNFTVVPGSVSYDYQSQTNVNIFINKDIDKFIIESGTPLVHMVPITDNKVELRHHLVDQTEFSKIGIPDEYDMIRPERYTRYIKEYTENNPKPKCPFGFGK